MKVRLPRAHPFPVDVVLPDGSRPTVQPGGELDVDGEVARQLVAQGWEKPTRKQEKE